MEQVPSDRDACSRLGLQALGELLEAQRERIGTYALTHGPPPHTPRAASVFRPPPVPHGVQELLDAVQTPAMLVSPVLDERGDIRDFSYAAQNARAHAYSVSRIPADSIPRSNRVFLFEQFPVLEHTPLPRMLAYAWHERVGQGPEVVEWFISRPSGPPTRLSNETYVAPCGEHLLVTWEPGDRSRMAIAAQKLVKTCWAEWNLTDGTVELSLGFAHVLGLDEHATPPDLTRLAAMFDADSVPDLYQALYEVLLRKHPSECELRMPGTHERVIRMVAEPVRPQPTGPVWAVRTVLIDVTDDHRRRERVEAADREARRQHGRAEALDEVAQALRDAVVPRFRGELASSGFDAAAVYRPDAAGLGVGGDWYKARRTPDGRLLVALGDARGHGLEAVTLMARLRYALGGLAYTEEPVEKLTQWLNQVACDDGIESTATAVVARYHPERELLRWTCAGHPRPVLLRDGRATQLPLPEGGPGISLGFLPRATYTAAEVGLVVGDIVLLYSDGLIERRDTDPAQDTARLLDAAERCLGEAAPPPGNDGLQEYAERLTDQLDGPHRTDDTTLLAIRRIPLPDPGASP
ncbi:MULTISPECIES: PP2C family protein-serine/threonine phosphatase [unclassified Streptomyces]|uniref:PP2C family protein-serine/threonine phosphatase n=1 Tax=unclassified Streptomyces TaxID=2593676 RepID=UPI003718FB58